MSLAEIEALPVADWTADDCVLLLWTTDPVLRGWEESGHTVEERLGPKDAIFNPAGRVHYFRNDGVADAEFMLLVGTARAEDVRFQTA